MKKLIVRYYNMSNVKVAFALLTLVALVMSAGAPDAMGLHGGR